MIDSNFPLRLYHLFVTGDRVTNLLSMYMALPLIFPPTPPSPATFAARPLGLLRLRLLSLDM